MNASGAKVRQYGRIVLDASLLLLLFLVLVGVRRYDTSASQQRYLESRAVGVNDAGGVYGLARSTDPRGDENALVAGTRSQLQPAKSLEAKTNSAELTNQKADLEAQAKQQEQEEAERAREEEQRRTQQAELERRRAELAAKQEEDRQKREAAAAAELQAAMEAKQQGNLTDAQQRFNNVLAHYGNTPSAEEARRSKQEVDAALLEQRSSALFEQAVAAQNEGRLADANRLLKMVATKYGNTPSGPEARHRQREVLATIREGEAAAALERATAAEEAGNLPGARSLLQSVAKTYRGTSAAAAANRRLQDIERAELPKKEEAAAQAYRDAAAVEGKGRLDEASGLYQKIMMQYAGTPSADKARDRLRAVLAELSTRQPAAAPARAAQFEQEGKREAAIAARGAAARAYPGTKTAAGASAKATGMYPAPQDAGMEQPQKYQEERQNAEQAAATQREAALAKQKELWEHQSAADLARAAKLQQEGKLEEAFAAYGAVARSYPGTWRAAEASAQAKAMYPALQAAKTEQLQKQQEESLKAEQAAAKQREAALARQKELQRQQQQQQQQRQAQASRALQTAKGLSERGDVARAKAAYQAVVARYPGTQASKEAQSWLHKAKDAARRDAAEKPKPSGVANAKSQASEKTQTTSDKSSKTKTGSAETKTGFYSKTTSETPKEEDQTGKEP